jgi:hypothetical protein
MILGRDVDAECGCERRMWSQNCVRQLVRVSGTYAMLAGSGTQLTNGGEPGKTPLTNLYLFRLATTPVGLGSVSIASSSGTGAAVTMIGAGLNRGALTQWDINTAATPWTWTKAQSGGDAAGYQTLTTREMRWGTNTVGSVGGWIASEHGDTNVVSTTLSYRGRPFVLPTADHGDRARTAPRGPRRQRVGRAGALAVAAAPADHVRGVLGKELVSELRA